MSINKDLIIILKIGEDDDILSDIKRSSVGCRVLHFFL